MSPVCSKLMVVAGALLLQGSGPASPGAAGQPAGGQHTWVTYQDPKGVFAQCYPADLLKPKSDSADFSLAGAHHESAETVITFGSLQDALRKDTDEFDQADGQTTYVSRGKEWFVFSGVDKGGIYTDAGGTVYERGVLLGKTVVTVQLAYPKAEAAVFDPVAAAMGKCLKAGTGAAHQVKAG